MPRTCGNCKQEISQASHDAVTGAEICPLCGTQLPPEPEALLPEGFIVAGFKIERPVGRGGMGTVYLATQMNLERPVALKVLSQKLSSDASFVERFFREARAAASLSHPNIVQAYDAGATSDGLYYFAMELIEGETLEKRIVRLGKLPVKEALDVAGKVADALNYAWQRQKLCHGDIKPDNIIIDSAGMTKLADLGLAKSMRDNAEHDGELMATPLFAPPELIRGEVEKVGAQSDMYSFGATLYNMLAGAPPFPGDDPNIVLDRQLKETPAPVSSKTPEAGPQLTAFVDKLLKKNPEERPASWAEIVETLKKPMDPDHKVLRVHSTVKGIQPHVEFDIKKPDPPPEANAKRTKLLVAGAAAIVLALAGTAALFVAGKHDDAKPSAQEAAKPKTQEAPELKPAERDWRELKRSLETMPPSQAISALQWYLEKHKGDASKEALDWLGTLRERVSEPFRKKLAELRSEAADAAFVKRSSDDLRKAVALVESVNAQASSAPFLASLLDTDESATFSRFAGSLKAELGRRQTEEAAKRKAEVELQEKERKEAELKRKAEAERKAGEARAAEARNAALDAWAELFAACVPLERAEGARQSLMKTLDEFAASTKGALPEKEAACCALLKTAASLPPAYPEVFINRCEAALKGMTLPDDATSGFVVDSADAKGFKLTQEEGKVKIGKKILWTQLKPDALDLIVRDRLLNKTAFSGIPPELQISLVAELLLDGHQELLASALELSSLKPEEKKKWRELSSCLAAAKREAEAVGLWKEAMKRIDAGEFPEALSAISEFSAKTKGTACFERRAAKAEALVAQYRLLSPQALAREMAGDAKNALAKGNVGDALKNASSAVARYAFLSAVDVKLKSELISTREAALSAMKAASSVKNLSDARLPFYYWDAEKPGDAWAYRCLVASSDIFKQDNPVFLMLTDAAGFDAGIFDELGSEMRNAPARLPALNKASGPVKNWTPSLLYGLSAGADRLQAKELKSSLQVNMRRQAELFSGPMRKHARALCIEQALLFRDVKGAESDASLQEEQAGQPAERKLDLRLALLKILAAIQDEDLKAEELKNVFDNALKPFAQDVSFKSDLAVCGMAQRLLSAQSQAPSPAEIQAFQNGSQAQPDLCARILADSFARAFFVSAKRGGAQELLAALKAKISPALVSAELFERTVALDFAVAQPQDFAKLAEKALDEERICALPLYTRLLLFNAAKQAAAKKSVAQGGAFFASFATGCPLLSESESRFESIANPESSPGLIRSLASGGEAKEAAWLAAASALANQGDAAHSTALRKALLNAPGLTWEERCMIRNLAR